MYKIIIFILLLLILVLRILYLENIDRFTDTKNIKELMDMANKAYNIEQTPLTFSNGINFNENKFDTHNQDRSKNTLEHLLMNQLGVKESSDELLFDGYSDDIKWDTYDSQTFFDKCLQQEHMIATESMNQNMKLINLKAELDRLINIEKPIYELKK